MPFLSSLNLALSDLRKCIHSNVSVDVSSEMIIFGAGHLCGQFTEHLCGQFTGGVNPLKRENYEENPFQVMLKQVKSKGNKKYLQTSKLEIQCKKGLYFLFNFWLVFHSASYCWLRQG